MTNGTIIRIPHQLGFPRASAMAIHRIMKITMFTNGIRQRMNHYSGFLAMVISASAM